MPNLISEMRLMWGMPITVGIVDSESRSLFASRPGREFEKVPLLGSDPTAHELISSISQVFNYFEDVDNKFSTYKPDSEISLINQGLLNVEDASSDIKTVFDLVAQWRLQTDGYFNIGHEGKNDPSGLVKGWAALNAANMLCARGCDNFYVEAGGDFQAVGRNTHGEPWRVGIRNPFNTNEIVKFWL